MGVLINGGFESGSLAPWYQGGHDPVGTWAISGSARTGSYAATISGNNYLQQDFAPTATSLVTNLSFWLRNTDFQESAVDLFYSDQTQTPFIAYLSNTEWTYFDLTSHLVPGKMLTAFRIHGHSQALRPNTTYLDDVGMRVVPEPLSLTALAMGVAALSARKRKK